MKRLAEMTDDSENQFLVRERILRVVCVIGVFFLIAGLFIKILFF